MSVRPVLFTLLILGPLLSRAGASAADEAAAPLASAHAVLSLTAEQAGRRLPIAVAGVVTAAEADWSGQFFLQDATGGIFVENLSPHQPRPGDFVTVEGVSHPGAFAPIVSQPRWRKMGTAALPEAKPAQIEQLESGIEDGLRVEVSGVVRTAKVSGTRLSLDLAVGGFRLQVFAPSSAVGRPEALLAARVRVRGTAATQYNAALRHLTSVAVYVPAGDDFVVLQPEASDPFAQPALPLNSVAQYRRGAAPAQRVHVRGIVTLQRVGETLFLQDSSGGLRVESQQTDVFTPGEPVDAAGFLEYEDRQPVLRDATLRSAGSAVHGPTPRVVPLDEIQRGLHQAALITLQGKLLDRSTRPAMRAAGAFTGAQTTWMVQGEDLMFTVEYESLSEDPALAAVPLGSVVEIDGVCVATVDAGNKLKSLRLLLPGPASLRVLARPSWLTPERLLAGLALVSTVLLAVVAWLLTVSKKNAALKELIRERERHQRELQEAHDTLEQKVVERTAQLKVEMTARKTAEVQFKAVLAERTRLARDLHDTLEQTLTGIALHLDTCAKFLTRTPEQAAHHLSLSRNWLHQSQVGLRRSIWDLRSRELEQFDLARALEQSGEQLVAGTGLHFTFSAEGERRALPEIVEENVLRVGQEAFTNIAKHAHARRVRATLVFAPHALQLRVADDGVGFDRPAAASGENHFGLLGMTERAKRLGGHIVVDSARGRGTTVTIEIPLAPAVANDAAEDASFVA